MTNRFYDQNVCEYTKQVKPSARGELEKGNLNVVTLGRGYAWLNTGTMDSLYEATEFVRSVETRAGIHISMPEEIAYVNGWIDKAALAESAKEYGKSPYGQYLLKVVEGKIRIE